MPSTSEAPTEPMRAFRSVHAAINPKTTPASASPVQRIASAKIKTSRRSSRFKSSTTRVFIVSRLNRREPATNRAPEIVLEPVRRARLECREALLERRQVILERRRRMLQERPERREQPSHRTLSRIRTCMSHGYFGKFSRIISNTSPA
jgi:hypothetical protein